MTTYFLSVNIGQDTDMERLNKLATFQRKALEHALLCKLVRFFLVRSF